MEHGSKHARARDCPHRNWCFTLNNPAADDLAAVAALNEREDVGRLAVGDEVGESGTPHLQGYLRMARAQRLAAMKKILPRAHWEPRKARHESDASKYALKDGKILYDKGYDVDPGSQAERKRSRDDEATEIMDEADAGEPFGSIRKRHRLFCFWNRHTVMAYISLAQGQFPTP